MGEHITKIKVGDDERCISLDAEVIDTAGLGFGADGKLGVKLGSSMFAEDSGIGVKIHPDTKNYLRPEPSGLSLMLDTMADAMAGAMGNKLGLFIDAYNKLMIGSGSLKLGTGLVGGDNGKTLCLSLGSGLGIEDMHGQAAPRVVVRLHDDQGVLLFSPDGELTFYLKRLYDLLESRYNLTKK